MKTQKQYLLPAIILAMIVTAFAFWAFSNNIKPVSASIETYESYNATTTRSTDASATKSSTVCLGKCQFGSLIVTQVGTAGYVRVWDATSTATSSYQDTVASTTASITIGKAIAKVLGTSDAAGNLTFDALTNYGIVIETSSGFDGEYVITWKK